MSRTVYRKAALDKLASPEELDRLMQITTPAAWITLGAFGSILLIALLWGIFGQVTTTLEQSGVLTLSDPVVFITSPEQGQNATILVAPGDRIEAGQVVARVTTAAGAIDVTSHTAGEVVSVRRAGLPVDAGTPLISVELAAQAAQRAVIAYVPLKDRQQLRVNMGAQILPSTVEREQYGYIEGHIASVAEFAATRDEMLRVLGDASFIDDLTRGGPVFEIRFALHTDADGDLVWSASNGPSFQIVSGTPCLIIVNVDKERPISRVFNLG